MALTDLPEDAPQELLDQLTKVHVNKKRHIIGDMVRDLGKPCNINAIIIAWYNQTGEIMRRQTMHMNLSRLMDDGILIRDAVGVYKTVE